MGTNQDYVSKFLIDCRGTKKQLLLSDLKYCANEDAILHTHWSDPYELNLDSSLHFVDSQGDGLDPLKL